MSALTKFLTMYLILNPKPSDAQVHALAASLSIDKEALEARLYRMLSNLILSDVNDALEQKVPVDLLNVSDLPATDGPPEDYMLEDQTATNDDGTDVLDRGVGLSNVDDDALLMDDV